MSEPVLPKWLIPSPHYSEDKVYVFQNVELMEMIRKNGVEYTRKVLTENMPEILDMTWKHYKDERLCAQNYQWYDKMMEFTEEAKQNYEDGQARIIMFYGSFGEKGKRTMLVF